MHARGVNKLKEKKNCFFLAQFFFFLADKFSYFSNHGLDNALDFAWKRLFTTQGVSTLETLHFGQVINEEVSNAGHNQNAYHWKKAFMSRAQNKLRHF